jgi:hypothetical protein
MIFFKPRTERERIIVHAMIRMYCRGVHGSRDTLCPVCSSISDYASGRLKRCVYGHNKPVCKDCPVHCYSAAMRERIRVIMRRAGPRMIFRHPVYAILHLIDSRTAAKPARPAKDSQ